MVYASMSDTSACTQTKSAHTRAHLSQSTVFESNETVVCMRPNTESIEKHDFSIENKHIHGTYRLPRCAGTHTHTPSHRCVCTFQLQRLAVRRSAYAVCTQFVCIWGLDRHFAISHLNTKPYICYAGLSSTAHNQCPKKLSQHWCSCVCGSDRCEKSNGRSTTSNWWMYVCKRAIVPMKSTMSRRPRTVSLCACLCVCVWFVSDWARLHNLLFIYFVFITFRKRICTRTAHGAFFIGLSMKWGVRWGEVHRRMEWIYGLLLQINYVLANLCFNFVCVSLCLPCKSWWETCTHTHQRDEMEGKFIQNDMSQWAMRRCES